MKYKLSKEEHAKLSDEAKKEYTPSKEEGEEDQMVLTVEGGEDVGALKRAKDYEKNNAVKAKNRIKELETEVGDLQNQLTELQTNTPDKKALDASWQQKYDKLLKEKTDAESNLTTEINRILVDDQALSLAKDLSDTPEVLLPHIKSRLSTELEGGKAKLRIKDAEGNPSALTVDELKTEFSSNKNFANVLRGSEGSGSGAQGGQGKGGGKQTPAKPDYTTASTKDIAAYRKSQREVNGQ